MARTTISQRIALVGGDEIERELRDLGEAGEKAFEDIQGAAEKLKGPGAEFMRTMDRVKKKINEVGEQAKKIGRTMRNWGAGLSLAITAPVTLLGRSFIQAATDAEEAGSAFDFLFEESAVAVREWAAVVAREMGRGTQAIQDQVATFQLLFSQTAPTHKAAVQLAQDFAVLAQDLASFYNMSESDALMKLRSGLAGETEPLRSFGVFLNAAAVEAKALEMGLTGVGDALTDQEKVLARAALIMEQTTTAQGDAVRTAESYANQLKRLQGLWQDLSVQLGTLILPVAQQVVRAMADIISVLQSLPTYVQQTIIVIAALAAIFGPLLASLGLVFIGAGMIATGFTAVAGATATVIAALASLTGTFAAFGAVFAVLAPFLSWPVLLGAAFGFLAVTIAQHWDEIVAKISDAFARIQEAATWEALADFAIEHFTRMVDGAEKILDRLALGFTRIFDGIRDKIASVVDWALDKLRALQKLITGALGLGGESAASGSSGLAGYSGGGRVRGPGSGVSDSVLARLSDGEFVIRAAAVEHYGPQIFDMLNRIRLPRFASGGPISLADIVPRTLEGFRSGGLVGRPVPAFANGGPVAAGGGAYATVNLSIAGETFAGLMGPSETVDRLIRFASREEVKSAGRRPNWYRGS